MSNLAYKRSDKVMLVFCYYSYTQHVSCHAAYHVTCGFQHNLLMQTKLDTTNSGSVIHEVGLMYHVRSGLGTPDPVDLASGQCINSLLIEPVLTMCCWYVTYSFVQWVKLCQAQQAWICSTDPTPLPFPYPYPYSYAFHPQSYCPKHTALRRSPSRNHLLSSPHKIDMMNKPTQLIQVQESFYKYASVEDLVKEMKLSPKLSTLIYNYWKLKRKVSPPVSRLSIAVNCARYTHCIPAWYKMRCTPLWLWWFKA